MSEDIKTKIIHYLAQRPDFEGVSTRDIEICNWVADQLKSQLDKAQSDLEREQKCVELAVSALEFAKKEFEATHPKNKKLNFGYWQMTAWQSMDTALTKIKSLREGEK